MLAFFGNLAPMELLLLAVVAVLVFGRRLPEVAGRGYTQIRRWRQSLDQLRRETGIDSELHKIGRSVREASRQAEAEYYPVHEERPDAELDSAIVPEPEPDKEQGSAGG